MHLTVESFLNELQGRGYYVYAKSLDCANGTVCAIVRANGKKLLAAGGATDAFSGKYDAGVKLCPLSVENAKVMHGLFPYTMPHSHGGHPFTFGMGDRLGLATPGHVRAI